MVTNSLPVLAAEQNHREACLKGLDDVQLFGLDWSGFELVGENTRLFQSYASFSLSELPPHYKPTLLELQPNSVPSRGLLQVSINEQTVKVIRIQRNQTGTIRIPLTNDQIGQTNQFRVVLHVPEGNEPALHSFQDGLKGRLRLSLWEEKPHEFSDLNYYFGNCYVLYISAFRDGDVMKQQKMIQKLRDTFNLHHPPQRITPLEDQESLDKTVPYLMVSGFAPVQNPPIETHFDTVEFQNQSRSPLFTILASQALQQNFALAQITYDKDGAGLWIKGNPLVITDDVPPIGNVSLWDASGLKLRFDSTIQLVRFTYPEKQTLMKSIMDHRWQVLSYLVVIWSIIIFFVFRQVRRHDPDY